MMKEDFIKSNPAWLKVGIRSFANSITGHLQLTIVHCIMSLADRGSTLMSPHWHRHDTRHLVHFLISHVCIHCMYAV